MDTEARHWGGYVIWLERARGQLPPAASALGWREIDDSHTDHLMELLREREAPHAAAIRTAIDAWIESGVWPELADVARWFLNLRMETSLNLVVQLCHCGEGAESSLWDFPAGMDEADVARYLWLDWWETHGRFSATRELVAARHDAVILARRRE